MGLQTDFCPCPHHSLCLSGIALIPIPSCFKPHLSHSDLCPLLSDSPRLPDSPCLLLCSSLLCSLRAMSAELSSRTLNHGRSCPLFSDSPESVRIRPQPSHPRGCTGTDFHSSSQTFPMPSLQKAILFQLQSHSTRAETALHRDHCSKDGVPLLRQGLLRSANTAAARSELPRCPCHRSRGRRGRTSYECSTSDLAPTVTPQFTSGRETHFIRKTTELTTASGLDP